MASFEPAKDQEGRNVNHLQTPSYAPSKHFKTPTLHKNAYKPRDLLNYAAVAFHNRSDTELSNRQLEARKDFVNKFKARKSAYGKKVKTVASLEGFKDELMSFFTYIDNFFFLGLLRHEARVKSGLDVVEKAHGLTHRYDGDTYHLSTARGQSVMQIDINIGADGTMHHLNYIVAVLMHEMVHAYLEAFGCDCLECEKGTLNTVGIDGHGPIFLMLHRLILTEIRRWGVLAGNPDLEMLDALDCPGQVMSLSARATHQRALDKMSDADRTWYYRFRGQRNPNYLIRLSANGEEVIVDETRLKDKRMKMEKMVRRQREEGKARTTKPRPKRGEALKAQKKPKQEDGGYCRGLFTSRGDYKDEEEDDDEQVTMDVYNISTRSGSISSSSSDDDYEPNRLVTG